MTIANSSQRETGARDTGTNGGETTGADTEVQGDADRSEARVEGLEIGCEVRRIQSIDPIIPTFTIRTLM